MIRFLFRALATGMTATVLMALVVGCGDEGSDGKDGDNLNLPDRCACYDGVCEEGECVLVVELEDNCSEVTEAEVYINDFGEDAQPAATIQAGESYTTCDGFRAPSGDDPGESFRFLVKTPDGRRISNTINDDFTCATSAPYTFKVDLCF